MVVQGRQAEEAEDIFDAYLPLIRHEQQPGLGLALRKYVLAGAARSAATAPRAGTEARRLDAEELDRLMRRIERRTRQLGIGVPITFER